MKPQLVSYVIMLVNANCQSNIASVYRYELLIHALQCIMNPVLFGAVSESSWLHIRQSVEVFNCPPVKKRKAGEREIAACVWLQEIWQLNKYAKKLLHRVIYYTHPTILFYNLVVITQQRYTL